MANDTLELTGSPELPTALVGPAVAGPRDALRALRFYAATPAAVARPRPLDRALWGAGQALAAAALVVDDARLRRAVVVPTALTFVGCAALALLVMDADGPGGLATFHAFLVSFVALSSMPPTVLHRMWLRVAFEARRSVGLSPGEDPYPGQSYLRILWRELRKALRQAVVVSAGLVPLLVVVRLLPFGRYESAALAGAWAFYWIVLDAFELPIEVVPGPPPAAPDFWFARWLRNTGRRFPVLALLRAVGAPLNALSRPWREEAHFTERHRWEVAGFAAVVGVLLAIPGVGLFFRSIAIVAGTALHARLEERAAVVPAQR